MAWLAENFVGDGCAALDGSHKSVMLAIVIFNAVIFVTALVTMWCTFDVAGRYWVKLKKYQKSFKDQARLLEQSLSLIMTREKLAELEEEAQVPAGRRGEELETQVGH